VRLKNIKNDYGDKIEIEPRVFMLRPEPDPTAVFNDYRRSNWERCNAQPEAGEYRMWEGGGDYPICSMTSAQAGLAARAQGPELWDAFHMNLLAALFTESRDISQIEVLYDVAEKSGLDVGIFRDAVASELYKEQAIGEYTEAINRGITGIPSVVVNDEAVIVGAVPSENYRHMIDHILEHGDLPRESASGLLQI
jgi:predicted DsbA family dithiol-disulfide isomerase